MQRLGHTDLQGRPSYQPNVIRYPDGTYKLFVGMHSGNPRSNPACTRFLPNPLDSGACENNGTMIIDVTDPRNPVELALIPAPFVGTANNSVGQAQMTRMCLGSQLTGDVNDKHVYLLRNVQTGNLSISGYEVWDVTDPKSLAKNVLTAQPLSKVTGLRSTHKVWWECSTGLMIAPGSKSAASYPGTPEFRQSQAMLVYDWHDVSNPPVYIRTFGLPGSQPGGTGPVPPSLHGAISAHDHPLKAQKLARGATADDVVGNRIYAAWGVGDDGVMTIIDRKKLLDQAHGGTWIPKKGDASRDSPDEDELIGPNSPTVGYFLMSPDQGGHTAMPVFGLKPPSMQSFFNPDTTQDDDHFNTRDIVLLASEATADGENGYCNEPPHYSFIVDVTVENSFTSPPGTRAADSNSDGRVEHDPYQGPMVLGTMSVDPRSGAKYARGNYCARGARFGVHSSEENFDNKFYGKLTALAYFNGGVRIWDIREPQAAREVAFYVPEANANTNPDGYMTNNVEIDDRGYVYVVDRNGAGMDVLQLTGCAAQIIDKGGVCQSTDANNAASNGD
jgi:hypothetical protein